MIDWNNKRLVIVVLTVGEPSVLDCLKAFKERTEAKHDLMAWYNCIDGFKVGMFDRLMNETNGNVICCTKNQGSVGPWGYSLMYLDYDFIVMSPADVVVTEGWLDKLSEPFEYYERLVLSGASSYKRVSIPHMLWEPSQFCPDKVVLINRDMLNNIGGICPSFKVFGDGSTELFYRIYDKGYSAAEVQDVLEDTADTHIGSANLPNKQELVEKNIQTLLRIKEKGFAKYDWWRNDN